MDYPNCSQVGSDDLNIRDCCQDALAASSLVFYSQTYKSCACAWLNLMYGVDSVQYLNYCVDIPQSYEVTDCSIIGDYGGCNSECEQYKSCYCLNKLSTDVLYTIWDKE